MLGSMVPVFDSHEGDLLETYLDVDRMSGWQLAGLGLALTALVLALSYGIALAWQRWRDSNKA